jgi:hypothetical protein
MADDWMAAAYACIVLWLLVRLDVLGGLGLLAPAGG